MPVNTNRAGELLPVFVAWGLMLIGTLHAALIAAGNLSLIPSGLVFFSISASGGFGVLLLAVLVLLVWSLLGVLVAEQLRWLLRRRSS